MEDSGLSQPLTPSKPLAPAVEVTSVSFVSFNIKLVLNIQDTEVKHPVVPVKEFDYVICCQQFTFIGYYSDVHAYQMTL